MSFADYSPLQIEPVSKSVWGSLAFDLVLQVAPLPDVLKAYNITEAQLSVLLDTPAFKATLKDAQGQMKQFGQDAGFVLRSRALAEDLLPDVYAIAKSPETDAVLRHRIFESLTRYALLDPATNKKNNPNEGIKVVFNLAGGIRGMEHVVPATPVVEVKRDE